MSSSSSGATGAAGGTGGTSTATTTTNASSTTEEAKVVIPDTTGTTLTTDVYGMFIGAFFVVLSVIVLFATGSLLSVLVLWAVVALVLTVMVYYGFVSIDELIGTKAKEEKKAAPVEKPMYRPAGGPLQGSEVFHVADQQFTYDEAPAVCAAYGTELATLEQIMDAFASGAEWCGYGWSAGGMALYPTQRETWERLQGEIDNGKRTRCGRPGVNGGYFDPNLKFGVNCYGIKPAGKFSPPAPVPGVDTARFNGMVNRFKELLKSFTLNPYSRQEWSEYDDGKAKESFTSGGGGFFNAFKQDFFTPHGVREHLEGGSSTYVEPVGETGLGRGASSLRAPYGLRGDDGDVGPTGPQGPLGPAGDPGALGPMGPAGTPGDLGPTGAKGDKGDKGDQGVPGSAGSAVGVIGPTGNKGDKGDKGDPGKDGVNGKDGKNGTNGAVGPQGPQGNPATVPRNLSVDTLKIGGWNFQPLSGGNDKWNNRLRITNDAIGTSRPVTVDAAGRIMSANPIDYREDDTGDGWYTHARGY